VIIPVQVNDKKTTNHRQPRQLNAAVASVIEKGGRPVTVNQEDERE
jgi:hypothetical protein